MSRCCVVRGPTKSPVFVFDDTFACVFPSARALVIAWQMCVRLADQAVGLMMRVRYRGWYELCPTNRKSRTVSLGDAKMQTTAAQFGVTVLAACLLVTVPAARAAGPSAAAVEHLIEPEQLQSVTGNMSPEEYRKAYRRNQRTIRRAVTDYSRDGLRSMGVPEAAVNLMGVAARLAVDQDAKFALGNSKLMAIELRDVAADDRSVLFGIKLRW